MATQFYETAQIEKKAAEVREQNAELRKIIASMEGIVRDLSSVWKDVAQTKFVKQFEELRPELDSFCSGIDKIAERAETHAKDVKKVSQGNGPV